MLVNKTNHYNIQSHVGCHICRCHLAAIFCHHFEENTDGEGSLHMNCCVRICAALSNQNSRLCANALCWTNPVCTSRAHKNHITFPFFIPHKTTDTRVHKLHVLQQGLLVLFPEIFKLACWGELTTTHFNGDFKGIAVEIVPVLHSSSNRVPLGSICNPYRYTRQKQHIRTNPH